MQTDTTKRSVAASGRRPRPHTRAAPRAVGPRPPHSCTKRACPLCVSLVAHPQPAGRPPWRCRASSRGSLSREPLHSEGQSHTCPHQAHSPQAQHATLHAPVTWGRARTPSQGAQHSPRWPGVGPHPCPPQGSKRRDADGWQPPPPGPTGDQGQGRAVPVSLPGGRGQHSCGQVHGCRSGRQGRRPPVWTHRHLRVQTPLAGSASPAQPRPPSLHR